MAWPKTRDLYRHQERLEACARRLALPTSVVRGRLSDLRREAATQHYLALCPHSEYFNVTGIGHVVA